MISSIFNRRSTRKFIDKPISQKDIIDIIQSGIKAPSSKNIQPWKFIVIQGNAKEDMINVFRLGIGREENDSALLPQSRQSISAAIQNMLLAATEKGIGSLWICDIYFAYPELCKWLDSDGQLIAAIAFGYPNEFPKERPRKKIDDVVEWRK